MKYADSQLIEAIRSGQPKQRDWALYQFYADTSLRQWAIGYVKEHGGNLEDGEDVFQEAICILDRNLRQGRFEGKSTLRTYFHAIIKWHWVTYRRKKHPALELKPEHHDGATETVEAQIFATEKKELLEMAIAALDARCQALLKYYRLDFTMKEIKELLGFSSPEMAKKQAYRCRERLEKVFRENPHLLSAFNIKLKDA